MNTVAKFYLAIALGIGVLFTVGAFAKWKISLPKVSGGGSGYGRSYGGSWGGGK